MKIWRGGASASPPSERRSMDKIYRCNCGKLVGDKMKKGEDHTGHLQRIATNGSLWEWIKVKLKVIK